MAVMSMVAGIVDYQEHVSQYGGKNRQGKELGSGWAEGRKGKEGVDCRLTCNLHHHSNIISNPLPYSPHISSPQNGWHRSKKTH